jgi:protein TonB
VEQPLFIPAPAPRLAAVPTSVPDLPIPAQPDLKREKPTQVVADKPIQKVSRRPISIVKPTYPERAEDRQISGYVDFEFTVQPDGSVGDPKVTAEVPEGYGFASAAQKVFPRWKFAPEMVNGKAVPTKAFYRFSFKLQ